MVPLNSTAFVAITGNGLTITEDLARRFNHCQLDAHCEDPELREFGSGFLDQIERRRVELLVACLTIWRWGRQNATLLPRGKPLGSFETWRNGVAIRCSPWSVGIPSSASKRSRPTIRVASALRNYTALGGRFRDRRRLRQAISPSP
jgi:hypothetical protein